MSESEPAAAPGHSGGSMALQTAVVVLLLAAIVATGIWIAPRQRLLGWLLILALIAFTTVLAGWSITGLWRGFLIDNRNMVSLSRLQTLTWTVLVLSAFLTAVFINVAARVPDALAVAVPAQLWLLLGISGTSLLGSPLLLSTKRGKHEPDPEQKTTTQTERAEQGLAATEQSDGLVVLNEKPSDARWSDVFRGEETGNAARLDLGKIQMFYFTVILVIAYAVALRNVFRGDAAAVAGLPPLPEGMVALLGISHTAYLGSKALPHSRERTEARREPEPPAEPQPATRKRRTKKTS